MVSNTAVTPKFNAAVASYILFVAFFRLFVFFLFIHGTSALFLFLHIFVFFRQPWAAAVMLVDNSRPVEVSDTPMRERL